MSSPAQRKEEPELYLSVLIPVYNEEDKIRDNLQKIVDYLNGKDLSCEIILVDDGSRDKSLGMVRDFFKGMSSPSHTILHFDQNRGKGFAIKQGMLASKGEYVLFLDADLSGSIEEIEKLFPFFKSEYDILIGLRTTRGFYGSKRVLLVRGLFGVGFLILGKLFLNLKVWDITCGFKCYKRRTVNLIFSRQLINGWVFDAENIFLAKKFGFKIKEVPIKWTHYAKGSKVRLVRDIVRSAWELLQIRINDLRGRYEG